MPKRLAFRLLLIATFLAHFAQARAQQPAEGTGGPAWQVTLYDITVTPDAAARAFTARAVITARNVGAAAGRTFTVRLSPAAKVTSASVGDAAAQVTTGTDSLTKLQTARLQLPSQVAPGGTVTAAIEYSLPVAENTGIASVSPEGLQLLPLSNWYPTPNTSVAPRGADYAPLRLSVKGFASTEQGEGARLVSTG